MKHRVISVESAEAFRDSILDVIEYTPHTLANELKRCLNVSEVDEGVKWSIRVFSGMWQIPFPHPVAWCQFDVTFEAAEEWTKRIAHCRSLLENQRWFHVEHKVEVNLCRNLNQHLLRVRYEPNSK